MTSSNDFNSETGKSKEIGRVYLGFLFFAGVFLPSAAFVIELTTRWCAGEFFDPMPTWWHVLFVFFVPVTNLQIWLAIYQGNTKRIKWLSFANAVTIFISLFYAIIFAPITPIAVFAIILFFTGLLPLSPLFSLVAAILMRRQLKKLVPSQKPFALQWKGLAAVFLLVLFAITLAELSFTLTKIGIRRANAESIEEQNNGVTFLRRFGNQDYLLRLCYDSSGIVATDIITNLFTSRSAFDDSENSSIKEQSRRAFYRLTGKHYRQMPTPRSLKQWERFEDRDSISEVDAGRINQGLSLSGSQIDGSVDGDAALGYLEWTLVFKNDKPWQQEAVSQIQLPPNAVVSRLTLWINGEEREAAFAKSAKVTEAYNAVTAKRRDPALVTMTGKDRIQLKCFPIEPNSEMKVRIGITTPLVFENETGGWLPMPYFQDRNFTVTAQHSIWIESKKALEIANPTFTKERKENLYAVRGTVKNDDLIKIGSPIRAGKSAEIKTVWAKDTNNPKTFVRQEIKQSAGAKIKQIVLIIDVSAQMKEVQTEIVEAVKTLAPDTETALILTGGNGLNVEYSAPNYFSGNPQQTAERINGATFEGGTDSVPAIATAWEMAQAKANSAVIWIHAPQSVELTPAQNLNQLWTRRPNSVPIYSVQTKIGRDVVESALNESSAVNTIPRFGSLRDDLNRLLSEIGNQKTVYEFVRTVENTPTAANVAASKETSQHLVRLWANDEVQKLLSNNEIESATDLAVKNQLVTRVSGAVVLENQQQYDQFGLRPVEPNTVPSIPEPEEYLLFGVVLAILIWFFWQFKKQKMSAV